MNPEISCYYRTSSPWRSLDNKLTPIFNQLKGGNASKQFGLWPEKQASGSAFTVPKHRQLAKFQRILSPKIRNQHPKLNNNHFNARYQKKMPSPLQTQNRSIQKLIIISPTSKIKKHLVKSIDYQGIENVLYQKNNKLTRYDQFYNALLNKEKKKKMEKIQGKNKYQSIEVKRQRLDYSPENHQNDTFSQSPQVFRITKRRLQPYNKLQNAFKTIDSPYQDQKC